MKFKLYKLCFLFIAFLSLNMHAQKKTITGVVSDGAIPLPGVNVIIKGTLIGVATDFDGAFSINATTGDILTFSYVGMNTKEILVSDSDVINVVLEVNNTLDEVVVTALGIKREKRSLGYATQEVKGDAVAAVKSQNFVNSLSGKIAGLSIKPSGTMGGSTQVIIRGNSSIAGNNQALFVIDGIPVDNSNTNTTGQTTGRGGYDYGNAASDINPDDIESINVLKGAAASALYGSRASNGVIMITTKKGSKRKGIGVTINSSMLMGSADKSTLPVYQNKYGAGYGPYYDSADGYFGLSDVNGDGIDDLTTPFTEDASYGAEFDPSLLVYQWNNIFPQLPGYGRPSPWVAGEHDPNYVWGTSTTSTNSVDLSGGGDNSTFRLGFTNLDQQGNLPNSGIKRNTLNFSGSLNLTDKLTATTTFTYTKTNGIGRYGTGYNGTNVMQQFRQFWQVNVDLKEQEQAYFLTRQNITWNTNSATNLKPIYSDNPYWVFYENYETDQRNRYFGNVTLNYGVFDWLSVMGRFTYDTYSELQEERINVGSQSIPSYQRFNNAVAEYNYDLMFNVNKDLTDKLNLNATLGFNLRSNNQSRISASTNGGLNLAGLYSLSNSVNPITAPIEYDATRMVDGIYGQGSLGYDNTFYIEGTYRTDRSSTLPKENNQYDYWSATGSIIFSKFLNADWLSFGKIRSNYGTVGNDTNPYGVFNTYIINPPLRGGVATNPSAKNNPNLRSERQENWEVGLEMNFFNKRLGYDVSYYNAKNIDQITRVPVSNSTGYSSVLLNAGTIQNKGWEVQLNATPIKSTNFQWDTTINWSTNKSLVVELTSGIENLVIGGGLQGGVTINATPGQPYGIIRGTDLIYNEDGQPIVGSNGYYKRSATSN